MAWYLERDGAPASRVTIVPVAGEVVEETVQEGGVFTALDGSRVVWQNPASPDTPTLPELHFADRAEVTRLRALVTSGVLLRLGDTDDPDGKTWRVRAVGGLSVRKLDTPRPLYRAKLNVVGV